MIISTHKKNKFCRKKEDNIFSGLHFLIVGCGFTGAVIAERIANDLKEKVIVADRRSFVGGLSYSEIESAGGIDVHQFGSHIFHTSDQEVWNYVNRFSGFNQYNHRVFAAIGEKLFTLPVNLQTINSFFDQHLSPREAREFLASKCGIVSSASPIPFENIAAAKIGKELFHAFFEGYSKKQWGEHYEQLNENIFSRLPVRFSLNNSYFSDLYQGIPLKGYGELFRKMLDHPNITLKLNTDFEQFREQIPSDCIIVYTGNPEALFQEKFGKLKWRSVKFEFSRQPVADWQGTAVVNYPELHIPYTRIHEFKHYHPENSAAMEYPETILCHEYPCSCTCKDEPVYPVGDAESIAQFRLYREEAEKSGNIYLAGRLGSYRYLNMDQAIRQALDLYTGIKNRYAAGVR